MVVPVGRNQNPIVEIRNKFAARNSKSKTARRRELRCFLDWNFRHSDFGFVSDFGFSLWAHEKAAAEITFRSRL
jgi:hypothetical protein